MDATNVGVRRVHPYSWSLSSPQQPPETEDSPTVSSCPTIYIARRMPRKRLLFNEQPVLCFSSVLVKALICSVNIEGVRRQDNVIVSRPRRKDSTPEQPLGPKTFLNYSGQRIGVLLDFILVFALNHHTRQRLSAGITQEEPPS